MPLKSARKNLIEIASEVELIDNDDHIVLFGFRVMPSRTLNQQWEALMALCAKEKELLSAHSHPRLLRLVTKEIEQIASEMGFSQSLIQRREFRAVREGRHITRVITS
jgi:hypothetical protein